METMTARDANRHFARILSEVGQGKVFVLIRDGIPVAGIVFKRTMEGERRLVAARDAGCDALISDSMVDGGTLDGVRVIARLLPAAVRGTPTRSVPAEIYGMSVADGRLGLGTACS